MPTRKKNHSRSRQKRRRDFEKRIAADSGNPLVLAPYECVLVHPLADDHELLASMDYPAARCMSVDAYWRFNDDVVFLQVGSDWSEAGLYGRRDRLDGRIVLTAILATQRPVDSATVARVMKRFVELRFLGADILHAPIESVRGIRVSDFPNEEA